VESRVQSDAVFAVTATPSAAPDQLFPLGTVEPWSGLGPKQLLDVFLSAVLLVGLAPVIAVVALAIKLDTRGPVFYRGRRVGFRGEEFDMLKFRKMSDGAGGPRLTSAGDERLTRCGRFLAATKLDELPQLWHVLTGRMSLVGPRPEDPLFAAAHAAEYQEILKVKPGITGLSQLEFVRETKILGASDTIATYLNLLLPAKVELDLLYVRNRSFLTDLSILAWTVVAVILRRDLSVDRASGRIRRSPTPGIAS
jgi:lipopolysaccharide/colanic/teichoic acid biosynthesis glycosyltransferase